MSEHCPACRVARELREHIAQIDAEWNIRRGALNFARILAERACPEYDPTTDASPSAKECP